jgi:Tfp pilus assembly PilM family ATPase
VFKNGVPCMYRSVSVGSGAFHPIYAVTGSDHSNAFSDRSAAPGYQDDYQVTQIIAEVKAAMEYYGSQIHTTNETIEKVWLCGGEAIRGLELCLAQELGVDLEPVNILSRIGLPRNATQMVKRELQADFVAAIGLAARGIL